MSPAQASAFAEAFRESREVFGVPVIFGTTELLAVVESSALERELVDGGFASSGDVSLKVLRADLPAEPAIGQLVTYRGERYKVAAPSPHPGELVISVRLRPAKR
jgi:hypothetical protein